MCPLPLDGPREYPSQVARFGRFALWLCRRRRRFFCVGQNCLSIDYDLGTICVAGLGSISCQCLLRARFCRPAANLYGVADDDGRDDHDVRGASGRARLTLQLASSWLADSSVRRRRTSPLEASLALTERTARSEQEETQHRAHLFV